MKKLLIVILTTVLTGGTISTSLATVMGFDELTPNYYVASVVANGYGGFEWVNWGVVGKIGGGYSNAPVSGMQSIFNSYSYAATISSEKTFDFNGAYFTSAHYNDNVVTIMGFQGGVRKYLASMPININGPQWLAANFLGVDKLIFSSSDCQFVMDDFTVNETGNQTVPVPEPATLLLLGSGLVGLVCSRRTLWSR